MPAIAAELIVERLRDVGKPVTRIDLAKFVEERHRSLGGTITRDPVQTAKKALQRLVEEGKLIRHTFAWYSLNGAAEDKGTIDAEGAQAIATDEVPAELIVQAT